MNPLSCALRIAQMGALVAVSLPASAATPLTPAALANCAAIAAPDSRLACYDALAGRTTPTAPSAPLAAAAPRAPVAVTAPVAPVAPAAPIAPSNPQNFGLTQAQLQPAAPAAPKGTDSIEARIAGMVDNPLGRSRVVLDNGQTWVFTEVTENMRLSVGDTVTIKRAALGSFLLTTPSKHAFHVRRTQ